jgi:hypothetical protein
MMMLKKLETVKMLEEIWHETHTSVIPPFFDRRSAVAGRAVVSRVGVDDWMEVMECARCDVMILMT